MIITAMTKLWCIIIWRWLSPSIFFKTDCFDDAAHENDDYCDDGMRMIQKVGNNNWSQTDLSPGTLLFPHWPEQIPQEQIMCNLKNK